MNWKAMGPLLGVIMLAALAFVYWPEVPVVPPPPPEQPPTEIAPGPGDPTPPPKLRLVKPFNPQGVVPQQLPSLGPNAAIVPQQPQQELYKLEPVPDPDRLRELGIPESAVEPEDAGVLHKLDRKALRAALREKYSEILKCSEGTPISKKAKLEFQIVEIPGRERAKVQSLSLEADGGVGRVAFERCARAAVGDLRFETPRGGETRVSVPWDDLGDNL